MIQNFWFPKETAIDLPKKADVVIIGGGLAGLITLYELSTKTPLSVVLFEQAGIGTYSSGRSIGHVGICDSDSAVLLKAWYGLQCVKELHELRIKSAKRLRGIIAREKIDCDYVGGGSLVTTNSGKLFEGLEWTAPERVFDAAEIFGLIPCDRFSHGFYSPEDYAVNPYKLCIGLAKACEIMGRHIWTNAHVDKVSEVGKVYVRNRGTIQADHVVYCTGAMTSHLLKDFREKLFLMRQHQLVTGLLTNKDSEAFSSMTLLNNDKKVRCFANRLLVSGEQEPTHAGCYADGVNEKAIQKLMTWMASVFPSIQKLSPAFCWSSIDALSKDGLPLIGEIAPKKYVNIGADISLLAGIVNTITDSIQGKPSNTNPFEPNRKM